MLGGPAQGKAAAGYQRPGLPGRAQGERRFIVGDPGERQGRRSGVRWGTRLAQLVVRARADLSLAILETGLIAVAYAAALGVRLFDVPSDATVWWERLAIALPVIVAVHLVANVLFGNYGHVWRYASVDEAMRLVAAAATSGFVLVTASEGLGRAGLLEARTVVPLSVLVLGDVFALGGMGALRFWSRMFSYRRIRDQGGHHRAIVVGTGEDAVRLARHRPERGGVLVVGFVEPDGSPGDTTRRLANLPVLGRVDDVPRLVDELHVDQVIIAAEGTDSLARRLIDLCMEIDVRLRVFQPIDELLHSRRATRDVRDLELTDLLPRETIHTDLGAVAGLLRGRRILVTGAGGSIGRELVRQILGFAPGVVIALDRDETNLHDAAVGWAVRPHGEFVVELADIRDTDRMEALFRRYRPQVVFHAAALKHVPILESVPSEAVKVNVFGTDLLVGLAEGFAVEDMVLISTDKAVEPSSIMGASKRVAEMIVQRAAARGGPTRFSAVRFGNVLGSRGSVVPTFTRQIQEGGPVTVSHADMERYFMTVDEAVQLVLQAATLAEGGEIFVLDMGEPVRIVDLAHRLIRLAGLVSGEDIEVVFTGVRPGEKFQERLAVEPLRPTAHAKVLRAEPIPPGPATLFDGLGQLRRLLEEGDERRLGAFLLDFGRARWSGAEVIDLRPLTFPDRAPIPDRPASSS